MLVIVKVRSEVVEIKEVVRLKLSLRIPVFSNRRPSLAVTMPPQLPSTSTVVNSKRVWGIKR
jgi:hypothetical protein